LAASLPVLTFHALDDRASAISLSPPVFRRSLSRLKEGGYRAISLLDAIACLRQGQPFPPRSFVITFDDGYQSVYEEAFPVLQRHGMPATVFLTVGQRPAPAPTGRLPSLNGRSMLAWPEIREMHRWGIDLGAHTLTHPDLTRLPLQRVEAEIRDSKATIEDELGAPVACFAYPYGRHDRGTRRVARRHFACACSDALGLVGADSDPHALERVDAYYLRTDRLFGVMLNRWFPWYLRARGVPRRIRRLLQRRARAARRGSLSHPEPPSRDAQQ
jgi:peptidoglycan/xylan/chitin deacetylase (PgdA/CDA1 family)